MNDELDAHLTKDLPPGLVTPSSAETFEGGSERFRLTDDGSAAWAMRKLKALRTRQANNTAIADDEIRRIGEWLDEVNRPLHIDAAFFEGLLVEYARECRDNPEDGRKTLKLPTGTVTSRSGQPRWTVDPDLFLPWARSNAPDMIRIKEEPVMALLKPMGSVDGRCVTEDGELIPGVSVEETEMSFKVSPTINEKEF